MLKDAPPVVSSEEAVPILLVDDEPVNLDALEAMLEPSGCQCVAARSADEALLALLDRDFAAIVLDIRLPGMSGIELARLIKRRRRTQHVPILFLTAHLLDDADVLQGYDTGAVDYLIKPVSADILRSKIGVFVDLFRKSRALARANEALQREIGERQLMEEALRQANQDLEIRVQERTAALREADRRKDEFLAALAHELRNPLAALHSAVDVLRLHATSPKVRASEGVMVRQLRQMSRLIDDLLDVSRITQDKLTLRLGPVDLSRAISDAIETSRPIIEQRRHVFSVSLPSERIVLDADAVRLAQVFSNLLDNAAKYTEPGGRIELTAQVDGDRVAVRVVDSGVGIEPAALPRVFEMFSQGQRASDRDRSGLGIGLTLVRRLVEMHGGTVIGRSAGLGRGSEFEVRLPVSTLVAGTDAPAVAEPGNPAADAPRRVLIVDDNRDAAEMLDAVVQAWGHETRVVFDGEAALRAAADFRPEAVLLDIGLPRLDGHEVARRLRGQPGGSAVLIVALTGWGQPADRERSQAAGIDHHLLKPVDGAMLRRLLAETPLVRETATRSH